MASAGEAAAASEDLRAAYRSVWQLISEQQQRIVADPRREAQRARLLRFQRIVELQLDNLDAATATWIRDVMPGVYEAGATAASLGEFTWTNFHEEAFKRHAVDLYDDLLSATRYVRRDVKTFIRKSAKLRALRATIDDTAQRQAAALAKDLADNGIAAITYRNGARHGLGEYAEMAIRTKTGVAYNDGTINFAVENGTLYFEVFDGPGCGWIAHSDPAQALGRIVTAAEAQSHPLSHPNCRRGFGPRPDLRSAADARKARGSVSPSQTRAQAAQDAARRQAQARRAARRRRVSRSR